MVMRRVILLGQREPARAIELRDTVRKLKAMMRGQAGMIVSEAVETRGNPASQVE
jgi:hypothetical protein